MSDGLTRNQFTLLSDQQWEVLHNLTGEVLALSGEVAEIGVYQGGSAVYLCNRFPNNEIRLIDTFYGIPARSGPGLDYHAAGKFSAALEEVKQRIPKNGKLYQLCYPDGGDPLEGLNLKFLHLDVDIWSSVNDGLNRNWSRMVAGGIILIDDYNDSACRGAQKAVNDFAVQHGVQINTTKNTPQAWLVKHA